MGVGVGDQHVFEFFGDLLGAGHAVPPGIVFAFAAEIDPEIRLVEGFDLGAQDRHVIVILRNVELVGAGDRLVPEVIGYPDLRKAQFFRLSDVVGKGHPALGAQRKTGVDVKIVLDLHESVSFSFKMTERADERLFPSALS